MNETGEKNLILLTDIDPKGDPPSTDMFFSERARVRSNLLDSIKLGIAIGLACGIMFMIISSVAFISDKGTGLKFFEFIFPGFSSTAIFGIFVGFGWSALYGFIFGIIIAVIYNGLVRLNILNGDSWETYA